jgi:S-adenosylmethionine-dependent methyltransferase
MSRLDSHIRQKIAQRDSIDLAARWLGDASGWIVEFGLGTGRSYSHLVERFPRCEVFCFDRRDVCHPRSRPPADRLYLGEFATLLADPALHARFAGRVVLLHLDLGSGGPEDETAPEMVADATRGWLRAGAVVLSDQELTLQPAWRLERVDTAGAVQYPARYFVYRLAR